MLPKVKAALTREVENTMEEANVNWTTIQAINIKAEWSFPMSWSTLHKLIKNPYYYSLKQTKALLEHYNIEYNLNYGIITLVETDYEPEH